MSLRLVRLDCPSCGSALRAEPHDVLFLCGHCGGGATVGADGLAPVETTALLPAPGRRAQLWLPAWLVEATVEVSNRVLADRRETVGSSGERVFLIPAFSLSLPELTRLARALTAAAGATGEVPKEPLPGGILVLEDAITLARHLVVGEEVLKPDLLASVEVVVNPHAHRLAAVPFERDGDALRCAVTGVRVGGGRDRGRRRGSPPS